MFLTPPEIQHQMLKAGRGYDRDDVERLLEDVTASYEQVWLERDELRSRVAELEKELADFHDSERLLSSTLVTAQKAADELRGEAEKEAQRIKQQALADLASDKTAAESELEDLRETIERFRAREREIRANLRAYLESALNQLVEGVPVQEAPVPKLVDALAPEGSRVEHREG